MKTLYLDVDGVLCPFSTGYPVQNTGWSDWRTVQVGPYSMIYATELVDCLNSFSNTPDVEIVWTTDWLSEAPELLAPAIGLHGENWAVLEASASRMEDIYPWWKMEEIEKHYFNTDVEEAVWIDDNINYAPKISEWKLRMGSKLHTINPNKNHGISVKHMKEIERLLG